MARSANTRTNNWIVPLLSVLCGGLFVWYGLSIVPLGDDTELFNLFAGLNIARSHTLSLVWWIWQHSTYRLAMIFLVLIGEFLPLWAVSLIGGILTASMFQFGTKIAVPSGKSILLCTLYIAALWFTLPWDALWMEFASFTNYSWTAGILMPALWLLFTGRCTGKWLWLSLPLAFASGWSQEGVGLPVCLGIAAWLVFKKRGGHTFTKGEIATTALFFAGFIMILLSPGFYNRVSSPVFGTGFLPLLAGSAWWVIILLAVSGILLVCAPTLFRHVADAVWLFFTVAAVAATAVMLYSGYGGRTGWFPQLFALTALFRLAAEALRTPALQSVLRRRSSEILSATLSPLLTMLIAAQGILTGIWQQRLARETEKAVDFLRHTDSGVLYMDYTPDRAIPPLVRHRVHGLPDDDDRLNRLQMAHAYGRNRSWAVLPECARNTDWNSFGSGTIHCGNALISTDSLPVDDILYPGEPYEIRLSRVNGTDMVCTPFRPVPRTFYLYTPYDPDPGNN